MFVLYDRLSGRYVGAGGTLTADPAEAVVHDQVIAAIRQVSRWSCEPVALVAVRASNRPAPEATVLRAAG